MDVGDWIELRRIGSLLERKRELCDKGALSDSLKRASAKTDNRYQDFESENRTYDFRVLSDDNAITVHDPKYMSCALQTSTPNRTHDNPCIDGDKILKVETKDTSRYNWCKNTKSGHVSMFIK